jgi:hypothetical protein
MVYLMLIFRNAEKDTTFIVDNIRSKIIHVTSKDLQGFYKFPHLVGELDFLDLPDYKTVVKFRKLVESRMLEEVTLEDTRKYLLENYPEYFI